MKQKMPTIGRVFYCRVNKYASSLRLPRYCHGEVEVDAGVNSTSTAAVVVVTAFGCTPSAQVLGSSSSTVAQSAVGTTPSSTASATTVSGPGFEIVSALRGAAGVDAVCVRVFSAIGRRRDTDVYVCR